MGAELSPFSLLEYFEKEEKKKQKTKTKKQTPVGKIKIFFTDPRLFFFFFQVICCAFLLDTNGPRQLLSH